MAVIQDRLEVRLAQNPQDMRAAHRLRYRVFVEELGGDGPDVDHEERLERDCFDPFFDHLVLCNPDLPTGDHVVGVYRLLGSDMADKAGGFYSQSEYDLAPLQASGRRLLELGRSCLDPAYRGGTGMYLMWNALAAYVAERGYEVLFGTASFHGTDAAKLAPALSLLHYRHLAPEALRVKAHADHFQKMDLLPEGEIDRIAAMKDTPALIKAYLRLGGFVGEGAFVDHAFNTTDVCLVLDTQAMNATQKAIYTRGVQG